MAWHENENGLQYPAISALSPQPTIEELTSASDGNDSPGYMSALSATELSSFAFYVQELTALAQPTGHINSYTAPFQVRTGPMPLSIDHRDDDRLIGQACTFAHLPNLTAQTFENEFSFPVMLSASDATVTTYLAWEAQSPESFVQRTSQTSCSSPARSSTHLTIDGLSLMREQSAIELTPAIDSQSLQNIEQATLEPGCGPASSRLASLDGTGSNLRLLERTCNQSINSEGAVITRGDLRCPYPSCNSTAFFTRRCDLDKHYRRHLRKYYCRVFGCRQSDEITSRGFGTKKDRNRHEDGHAPSRKCQYCGNVFSRLDNLRQHCRKMHNIT